jgi:hypothetical protein
MAAGKQLIVKMFDVSGVLRATISDATLSNFDWVINGGLGNLTLQFARPIDDFGEGSEIDLNFRVQILVFDKETPPEGKIIYSGYIESYTQKASGNSQSVQVTCVGFQSLFSKRIHKTGSNTTVPYSLRDPSYMIKDAIEKMAGRITTTTGSAENTGLSISYTFRNNTVKEVIDKALELSPNDYFWYVDATDKLNFAKAKYDVPEHQLVYKRDFTSVEIEKTMNGVINSVYFTGGGNPNLFRRSVRNSSINEYGRLETRVSDLRVTLAATADQIATTELDRHDHPSVRIRVTLADSNIPGSGDAGVDIERFAPGQVVQLRNLVDDRTSLWDQMIWDVDFWDFHFLGALANPFIIVRVQYAFNSITLELGEFQDIFGRAFRSLEEKVETGDSTTLPSGPVDA